MVEVRTGLLAGSFHWRERQAGIEQCDVDALTSIQLARDPRHLRVVAIPGGIGFELPLEVTRIERRQPRCAGAVAFPLEAMAGEAGIRRTRTRSAEGDQSAILSKAVERGRFRSGARREQRRKQSGNGEIAQHATNRTARRGARFHCALLSLAIVGCKPPPEEWQPTAQGDPARGLAAIERVGCGSCHRIPGVAWPQGTVGPALESLAERALIAGKLPNRPDVLAGYIRNAPAWVAGSGMPAMPVTTTEARDIAAYLYEAEAN